MNGQVTTGLRRAAHLVLAVVAVVGVVLSWDSLYAAAVPTFGPVLAAGFPLLADALAAGASLMYVSGARHGRGRAGWRLTAHAAIAATITLNALAAPTLGEVPWHVTAPAAWAVLVELYAREAAGAWKAEHVAPRERIPGRLWLTAPVESARTWLRQGRTGVLDHGTARVDVGVHAAAVEALRLALPGRDGLRVRRILGRQLRAGSMPPAAVLAAVGWTGEPAERTPEAVLRAALRAVLAPGGGEVETTAPGPVTVAVTVEDTARAAIPARTDTSTDTLTDTLTETLTEVTIPALTETTTETRTEACTEAVMEAVIPARAEGGRPARRRPVLDTATRVARLAEKHPEMSAVEIARRIGKSPATVRRYLAAGRLETTTTDTPVDTPVGSAVGSVTA